MIKMAMLSVLAVSLISLLMSILTSLVYKLSPETIHSNDVMMVSASVFFNGIFCCAAILAGDTSHMISFMLSMCMVAIFSLPFELVQYFTSLDQTLSDMEILR